MKRTLRHISDQSADPAGSGGMLPQVLGGANAVISGPDPARYDQIIGPDMPLDLEPTAIPPGMPTLESIVAGEVDDAVMHGLANSFGLPLSILQKAPGKTGLAPVNQNEGQVWHPDMRE